jgi:hypothetical protein
MINVIIASQALVAHICQIIEEVFHLRLHRSLGKLQA